MHSLFETFVHIVEQETLVKAAETLHITQPTVSRQLQQLESDVGMALFDRVGRRLVLNAAGQVVYRYAKQYLALQGAMAEELHSFANPDVGVVRIGAGLTPSIYLLPPWLAAYRRTRPGVQFVMRTGSSVETLERLAAREVDLGVVTTFKADRPEFLGVPLLRDDLLLVAAPDSWMVRQSGISVRDLNGATAVLLTQTSGLRRMVDELTQTHGLRLSIAMETDSLENVSRLVQAGAGVAFMPRSSAKDDIDGGKLVEVRLQDADLGHRTITLVTRRDSFLPAVAKRFADYLPAAVQPHQAAVFDRRTTTKEVQTDGRMDGPSDVGGH